MFGIGNDENRRDDRFISEFVPKPRETIFYPFLSGASSGQEGPDKNG
jgi:hypothetical protein